MSAISVVILDATVIVVNCFVISIHQVKQTKMIISYFILFKKKRDKHKIHAKQNTLDYLFFVGLVPFSSFVHLFLSLFRNLKKLPKLLQTRSTTLSPIQILIILITIKYLSILIPPITINFIFHKRHICWIR
jgi:hypothetical protein